MSGPLEDPLVVNVAGLLAEPPGSIRDVHVESAGLDLGEGLVQAAPLDLHARLARTNRGLILAGRVATLLADTCSRCLIPVEVPVEAPIEEEVLPSIDLQSGIRLDTSAEPEVYRLNDHHELDLEPLAREAVQLAAPIAPVCRPDCRGLCPVCGADLNAGPHDHGEAAPDARLAALLEFQPREEGEEH